MKLALPTLPISGMGSLCGALVALAVPASHAADACSMNTPLTGGTTRTSDGTGSIAGGYHYELWHDGGGSMKMTTYNQGAAFKADWNNAGDFLARVGLKFDETKTYDQYGRVEAEYNYVKTGSGGGYSFIGIYGWSKNPLVEYYIVDDWYGNNPPTGGGTLQGQFDVDGGTYKIYKFQRVDKPSIIGNTTFWQFFSVRQKARQCGMITISEHWKKWASLNMTMGKMYEAKILVEAGGGVGTFDLRYGTVKTNVTTTGVTSSETLPEISRASGASWNTGRSGTLSLVSMDGTVLRTANQDGSTPAVLPTSSLPRGLYVLRFQAPGEAPLARKFLLD